MKDAEGRTDPQLPICILHFAFFILPCSFSRRRAPRLNREPRTLNPDLAPEPYSSSASRSMSRAFLPQRALSRAGCAENGIDLVEAPSAVAIAKKTGLGSAPWDRHGGRAQRPAHSRPPVAAGTRRPWQPRQRRWPSALPPGVSPGKSSIFSRGRFVGADDPAEVEPLAVCHVAEPIGQKPGGSPFGGGQRLAFLPQKADHGVL